MDPATILVLLLCAGVLALLVCFEVNSRRNEATKRRKSDAVHWFESLPRDGHAEALPKTVKK